MGEPVWTETSAGVVLIAPVVLVVFLVKSILKARSFSESRSLLWLALSALAVPAAAFVYAWLVPGLVWPPFAALAGAVLASIAVYDAAERGWIGPRFSVVKTAGFLVAAGVALVVGHAVYSTASSYREFDEGSEYRETTTRNGQVVREREVGGDSLNREGSDTRSWAGIGLVSLAAALAHTGIAGAARRK